jgi:chloramphenicol O-acetyltransferase type B
MSGITIGDGAVIASFSHVIKNVNPYEVVGGNPERHIRFRFPAEDIEELLKISWWGWPRKKILMHRDLLVSSYNHETLDKLRSLKY